MGRARLSLTGLLVALAGCASVPSLPPTPNLYVDGDGASAGV